MRSVTTTGCKALNEGCGSALAERTVPSTMVSACCVSWARLRWAVSAPRCAWAKEAKHAKAILRTSARGTGTVLLPQSCCLDVSSWLRVVLSNFANCRLQAISKVGRALPACPPRRARGQSRATQFLHVTARLKPCPDTCLAMKARLKSLTEDEGRLFHRCLRSNLLSVTFARGVRLRAKSRGQGGNCVLTPSLCLRAVRLLSSAIPIMFLLPPSAHAGAVVSTTPLTRPVINILRVEHAPKLEDFLEMQPGRPA